MTIHTKTALILLCTLVLGILLGVLASGAILRHFMHPDPRILSEHFIARFEEIIDPDETQRDTIREILESYSDRFIQMHDNHHSEMTSLMDSLHTDLSSVLTEEQLLEMRKVMERRQRWMDRPPFRRRGHGPPKP
jgi:hypothetical protein